MHQREAAAIFMVVGSVYPVALVYVFFTYGNVAFGDAIVATYVLVMELLLGYVWKAGPLRLEKERLW